MATVKTIWQTLEFDDESGKPTKEQKVFAVYEGDKLVGRFFPTEENEKEVKAKADSFAKAFKVVEVEEPKYITREVEVKEDTPTKEKSVKKSKKKK